MPNRNPLIARLIGDDWFTQMGESADLHCGRLGIRVLHRLRLLRSC